MSDPDPYMGFKKQIGYTLIIAAVLYGVMVTLLLVFVGATITNDQILWGFINTVVSTMLGWLLAKSGTVIDNVWGTSQSSERKTEIMAETAKAAVEAKAKPIDPIREADEYVAQTEATVVKATIAADNAVENVEDLNASPTNPTDRP